MDDSPWQVRCSSTTLPSSVASSSSTSQKARNQMEINSGQYFYPHSGLDLRSQGLRQILDPIVPGIPNSSSYSCNADLGNSFLALLSGPPSLFQCDFQELPNSKQSSTSSEVTVEGSSMAFTAIGTRVPLMSNRILSENLFYQNQRNGVDPLVSLKRASTSNSCGNFVLQHGVQAAKFGLLSSDLAKAVIHQNGSDNEKLNCSSPLREAMRFTNPANAVKLQGTNYQLSPKLPIEAEPSVSNNSFAFSRQHPRVFCLGKIGELLLSNTGLLGILCSCHCFQMSVSKFCEHSGLWNANPGANVHMESGETIAQWRKLYFQKFGIRAPEDHSGWDWPEGLPLNASLVKSTMPIPLLKSSDCNRLCGSSGGPVRSGQHSDSVVFSMNSLTDLNSNQNSVIERHSEQQKNGQGGHKFFGFVGTLQSNLHGVRNSTPHGVTESTTSRCMAVPTSVVNGPENGHHSISDCIDNIVKSGSFLTASPALQNARTQFWSSDVSRAKDVIMDKDSVSSSIELRLGQPNQQSQPSTNPVLSAAWPQSSNILVDSQKRFSRDQMIQYVTNCGEEEESRQCLPHAGGMPNSRREQDQLDYGPCSIKNLIDVGKLEKFKGEMAKSKVFQPFKHFNTPLDGNSLSRSTNNVVDSTERIMLETLQSEAHAVKYPDEFGFFRHRDKATGAGCLTSNTVGETSLASKMHNPSSLPGVINENIYAGFPAMHEKNQFSYHLSSIPLDASGDGNLPNILDKIPCLTSTDHVFHGALVSSVGSGQMLPSQAVPIGYSSSNSTSISGLPPALLKQDRIGVSSYLLDDNLRLLAWRQIVELSKQQHEMSSLTKNLEQDGSVKRQHSRFEPSASGSQRHRATFVSKQDASEVATKSIQSTPTFKMGDDVAKFAHMTGSNNWSNFSTLTQGMSFCCKETDKQHPISHGHLQNEQPSPRLCRKEDNIAYSNEHESCLQLPPYLQTYCGCAAHMNCLGGKCRGGNHPNSFRELMGGVDGKTPALMDSHTVNDNFIPRENTISLDPCGKLKGQALKNISCCTSRWKDVPSKMNNVKVECVLQSSADILDRRGHELDHVGDTAVHRSSGAVHMADSNRENISNISSGCSTPAVTQESIEVNNADSSFFGTGNASCRNHLIVDEGSGIDKCWSSDDAFESDRSANFLGSTSKKRPRKGITSKAIVKRSSRSLLDEVKLMDSLTWKRGRNQIQAEIIVHEKTSHPPEFDRCLQTGKRKREMKLDMLDSLLDIAGGEVQAKNTECDGTALPCCFSTDLQMVSSGQEMPRTSDVSSIKHNLSGKSLLPLSKPLSLKRDSQKPCNNERVLEDDDMTELSNNATSYKLDVSCRKKFRNSGISDGCMRSETQVKTCAVGGKTVNCDSASHTKMSFSQQASVCCRKARPVVCGKYGEISNGDMVGDPPKPAKIVSLDRILRTARKCIPPKNKNPRVASTRELKRGSFCWTSACIDKLSIMNKGNGSNNASGFNEMNLSNSVKEREIISVAGDKHSTGELSRLEKERDNKNGGGFNILESITRNKSRPKFKEIRRRSLNELSLEGGSSHFVMLPEKTSMCGQKMEDGKIIKSAEDPKSHTHGPCKVNAKRNIQEQELLFAVDLDSFCCVCGSSNSDEVNCLLECGQCLIKVHQACYGVSRVPKGLWYCRPCRTGAKDIVCILCGYGGGAMTQALRSRAIVKSLLKAWRLETESRTRTSNSSGSALENNSYPVLRPEDIEPSTSSVWRIDMQNQLGNLQNSLCCVSNMKVTNSITAGALDSTVKQWVHMVCGLWTPGTRCPNVDTMSSFDVSGVSLPCENTVCSACDRPGGSCIQCRVVNCSVQFHPWCAHQKGLLQSEVEGLDNENVGFYGRCAFHATYPTDEYACDVVNKEAGFIEEKEWSCSRAEGYKGRKRDGFWHNLFGQPKGKGGCLFPQEQLNAWTRINGQKPRTLLPKLSMSDVEHDCRKEYARYKQAKGWKHLVVYKSGIHALGLYTSRFIYRGEMVVEYVGEIVGQRVADKRESEYGRKLQYKSACYFFKIDKEHIIDATCKGGIARFVNHSCLPNCVAKVISVRNEKKVVFFAERDIYPGEEITYDYHFNHEDEGKKIPCFCNSKNCRRYLN